MSKFEIFCDVDGKRIREMCKENNVTVKDVASKIGISTTSLYGYLDRERMPVIMARQVMDAIWDGVPPFYYDQPLPEHGRHELIEKYNMSEAYMKNLLEAKRQIDIAIKKLNEAVTA